MSYLLLPNQDAAGFCGSDSDVIFPAGSLGRSGSKTLAKRSRTELRVAPGANSRSLAPAYRIFRNSCSR